MAYRKNTRGYREHIDSAKPPVTERVSVRSALTVRFKLDLNRITRDSGRLGKISQTSYDYAESLDGHVFPGTLDMWTSGVMEARVTCRPDQFVRFLKWRMDNGIANAMEVLEMELFDAADEPKEFTLDVAGRF